MNKRKEQTQAQGTVLLKASLSHIYFYSPSMSLLSRFSLFCICSFSSSLSPGYAVRKFIISVIWTYSANFTARLPETWGNALTHDHKNVCSFLLF